MARGPTSTTLFPYTTLFRSNQGTLVAQSSPTVFNGAVTNAAGATLRLLGGPQYESRATFSAGLTNQGTIELTSTNSGNQDRTLEHTGGTLTHVATVSRSLLA